MSSNHQTLTKEIESIQEKLKSFEIIPPPQSGLVGVKQPERKTDHSVTTLKLTQLTLKHSKPKYQVTRSQMETLLAASSVLLRRRFAPRSAEMEWELLNSK